LLLRPKLVCWEHSAIFRFQLLSSIPENRAGAAHHSPHVASTDAPVWRMVFSRHMNVSFIGCRLSLDFCRVQRVAAQTGFVTVMGILPQRGFIFGKWKRPLFECGMEIVNVKQTNSPVVRSRPA
jgi:hypothetical protein